MINLDRLRSILTKYNANYEIIKHDKEIHSIKDAEGYFDIKRLAPVLIIDTEKGLYAVIKSTLNGKINFEIVKKAIGCNEIKMAAPDKILFETGFNIGAIPLVGLSIPYVIDKLLLRFDYIYGGTGELQYTLKIAPNDVIKVNNVSIIF